MRPNLLLALCALAAAPAAARPFSVDDLLAARRITGFDVSRDGRWLAYAVSTMDVAENKSRSAVWMQPLVGGPARQMTAGAAKDSEPRFSPDGRTLAFLSTRDGDPQIFLLDLAGGEPRKLSKLPAGADGLSWSGDGRFLVTASEVFPECGDLACTAARLERMEKSKVKARVVERLLYRRWDHWADGKRTHLFRVDAASGEARDLSPGDHDAPPFSLGGMAEWDVSPDGKFVVFASNHDKMEAASTNGDLWEVPSSGGQARCLTCDNPARDGSPRYSPDGKSIAYLAQKRPGHESDRFVLRIYDRAARSSRALTEELDGWVDDFAWGRDGQRIAFVTPEMGRSPIFTVPAAGGAAKKLLGGATFGETLALADGSLVFTRCSIDRPIELFRLAPGAERPAPLTHVNDALFQGVQMGALRERWYDAADGKKIHAFVVLPPGHDERRRYPALLLVHGGPEGEWGDSWTYRWNAEVMASAGYVVYLPNPRGSVGYGQKFTDEIEGDWGGKAFDDLMRGADDLEKLPYVDRKRVGAAGASFGGFMINWFQGHTDRFKALLCHDGISDQQAMYATEELWFPEAEFGGLPGQSDGYRKASPIEAAARFKTPELIVHGERDYRIPYDQAMLMYSLLARRGVPAKLIVFPDENHWVLKPANARLWWASFLDWFHRFLGGAAGDGKALDSAYSVTK